MEEKAYMEMTEKEYMKIAEENFEEALRILIATSTDECVDLWEMQIRAYVKTLKDLKAVNDMISGGSTITIKEEKHSIIIIKNPQIRNYEKA